MKIISDPNKNDPMVNDELNTENLKSAYSIGFFPMPDPFTGEIKWYKPDPRAILPLNGFHCSKSLSKKLKKNTYKITFNKEFKKVMELCADREETWINSQFIYSYTKLHMEGYAKSVEIWNQDNKLVGGTYGVALGGAFFAESMFHLETDCSKIALFNLVQKLKENKYILLEVQFLTSHLKSLGAIEISLPQYLSILRNALDIPANF